MTQFLSPRGERATGGARRPSRMLAGFALATGLSAASLLVLSATAPAQGSAQAAFAIGEQADLRRDYGTALRRYREAAEQGLAEAQFRVGLMYENGQGVARDDGEALRWYRKAAGQAHLKSQSNLARMYSEGRG